MEHINGYCDTCGVNQDIVPGLPATDTYTHIHTHTHTLMHVHTHQGHRNQSGRSGGRRTNVYAPPRNIYTTRMRGILRFFRESHVLKL